MHEASLAAPLLQLVLEETARHQRAKGVPLKVTRVRVRAGLLMGVEAATLQGIFSIMAEGGPAAEACLIIEPEPMRGHCPDCEKTAPSAPAQPKTFERKTSSRNFFCPVCGGENVAWKGGNELYIASITVEQATHTACGTTGHV